jgi:hypothetical protein
MTATYPPQTLRSSSESTYLTSGGIITLLPKFTSQNDYGFVFETHPAENAPSPPLLIRLREFITTRILPIITCDRKKPIASTLVRNQIVPSSLQHHLINITPPANSTFPTQFPRSDQIRIWLTPARAWKIVQVLREEGLPEVYIIQYPSHLRSERLIKAGDVIFVEGNGYYISGEIGQLPFWAGWMSRFVALEGYNVNRERVLIFVPNGYMETPEMSASLITGELGDEDEGP